MKRDKFLGQDPAEKIVFAFFFERNRKKISLFVQYENDTDIEYAQRLIMIYTIFWESGLPLKDIVENFENDPNRQNSVVKLWHTMP